MKIADHTNFVSVLSEEKPVMVFFHHKAEASQTEKIKLILHSLKKDLPLLPLYEYIIDDNEENQTLAEYLGMTRTPILIFYKHGNFHRFKNKAFNEQSIKGFIGYTKPYIEPKEIKEGEEESPVAKKKTAKPKTVKTTKSVHEVEVTKEDIVKPAKKRVTKPKK